MLPLGQGDSFTCYLDGTEVVRVARHAEAVEALRREICFLPPLHEHMSGLVPRITGAGGDFITYPLLPGKGLTAETLDSKLIAEMATLVAKLHRFPIDIARRCGVPELDPRFHLRSVMDRARERVAPRLDAYVWRYYERLFELQQRTAAYTTAFLHNDLSPDHFLVDAGRITGLIDFGDAVVGDPHWDLIFILEDLGPSALDEFLDCHSPRDKAAAARRVRVYQQLNNVGYCLSRKTADAFDEALHTLREQATAEAISV